MSLIPFAALALLSVALTAEPSFEGPKTSPLLGLSLNVPEGGGETEFLRAIREQVRLGVKGSAVSISWAEIEKAPGQYDFKTLEDSLNVSNYLNSEVALTIKTLDTNKSAFPADLTSEPFDSPKVLERWNKFLNALNPKLRPNVKWVSLGNEVNVFLLENPKRVESYVTFLQQGRQAIRLANPARQVGVTTTVMDSYRDDNLTRKLNQNSDVLFLTYYPIDSQFKIRPSADLLQDVKFAQSLAEGKKIIWQEFGVPSDAMLGSSPERQAQVIKEVLGHIRQTGEQSIMVCYFLQCDLGKGLLDLLENYYGLKDPKFRAFLGSLGLRTNDWKAKPALAEFAKEALRLNPLIELN